MLGTIWNTVLINPIFNALVGVYHLTNSLGLSIIVLTILIKLALVPAMIPSMKTMKKQRDLQPEIDKLKEKYKHDKKKLAEEQMALFKQHGINPASGCLSQIAMIFVLIALYGVIQMLSIDANIADLNTRIYFDFLKLDLTKIVQTTFFYLNLAKPDPFYILAILSAGLQFVASKMMMPYNELGEKAAKKTPEKTDDIAYNMQGQMLYTMPIMNFVIGLTLPSGMMLYIVVSTIFAIVQTYFFSGWGGMAPLLKKVGIRV